ncbi:sialidase family protein [Adhaeretor mobilis]|uniref:Exo-alpha-sialidase n=1 Tax=Adhaeretor mobilis TaxID=1930276 RepID=A0A517MW80_9BACT|nr:sialidase family protein [Adhaeretor mobilis]QDS99128.1 hypothetical protein HG15A2_24200 [Adhaeretor mobilis]
MTYKFPALLLLAFGGLFLEGSHANDLPAKPTSVEKIFADGKHNAFTAFRRWNNEYWLAFRRGGSHHTYDGDIVLLRSSDAVNWEEASRFNITADDRDPQLIATPERLFLYSHSKDKSNRIWSFVTYTDDGQNWSKPQKVYQDQYLFWKPITENGRHYATAHKKTVPKEREVHLITSTDGINWEKISTISAGNSESETTLWFAPDDTLTAFRRTKHSMTGHILEASPPYKNWGKEIRPAGVHLAGHCIHTIAGTNYLISRTDEERTMIYTYENGALTPYAALPSGGDCSYAEVVQAGDDMLVSYYSSHEGDTNIYLARVPLKTQIEP